MCDNRVSHAESVRREPSGEHHVTARLSVDLPVQKKACSQATSAELLQETEGQMSATLQRALTAGLELNWQSRHELIQLLADILYGRDHYPSTAKKSGLAKALVTKYPFLRSRLSCIVGTRSRFCMILHTW